MTPIRCIYPSLACELLLGLSSGLVVYKVSYLERYDQLDICHSLSSTIVVCFQPSCWLDVSFGTGGDQVSDEFLVMLECFPIDIVILPQRFTWMIYADDMFTVSHPKLLVIWH